MVVLVTIVNKCKMRYCYEKHKIILNSRDADRNKESLKSRNNIQILSIFMTNNKIKDSGKFKRDFEPKKYTFATFK